MERLKRWVRRAGWAAALLLIITTLAWTATNWVATRRLKSAIEEWRAQGYEVTGSLLAPPPVSPKDNAARYFDAAFALFLPPDENAQRALSRLQADDTQPTPEEWDAIRAWIDSNAPALELVRQGGLLPKCRYNWDYDSGLRMRVPQLTSFYKTFEALAWRARLDAGSGNFEHATDAIRSALALARSFEKTPLLVTGLVGVAVKRRITEATGQCISSTTSLADLQRLKELLPDESSILKDLGHALRGEVVFTIDQVTWATDRIQEASEAPALPWGFATPFLRLDEASHLRRMIALLKLCAEPPDRALAEALRMKQEVSNEWTSPFGSGVFPAMVEAFRSASNLQKYSAMTRAGLQLEIARLTSGSYPEKSDVLDPTTGRPFTLDLKAGLLRSEPASPGQYVPKWHLRHP